MLLKAKIKTITVTKEIPQVEKVLLAEISNISKNTIWQSPNKAPGSSIYNETLIIDEGEITVPARKFFDICRALPDGAMINFSTDENKCLITAGKSKFSLSTLSATEYPLIENIESYDSFSLQSIQSRLSLQTKKKSFFPLFGKSSFLSFQILRKREPGGRFLAGSIAKCKCSSLRFSFSWTGCCCCCCSLRLQAQFKA